RTELNELLAAEIADLEKQLARAHEELWRHRSPFGFDALMGPEGLSQAVMLRFEESSFRQVWRITNLLMKLQRADAAVSQNEGDSEGVIENKGRPKIV